MRAASQAKGRDNPVLSGLRSRKSQSPASSPIAGLARQVG